MEFFLNPDYIATARKFDILRFPSIYVFANLTSLKGD
jgi:hypothetical protein